MNLINYLLIKEEIIYYQVITFFKIKLFLLSDGVKLKGVLINPTKKNEMIINKKFINKNTKPLNDAKKHLADYMQGVVSSLPLIDLNPFTDKQKKVYETLLQVPIGATITYKELAEKSELNNGFRFVGTTMKNNLFPFFLPCHRVIKSNGDIGDYSGGFEMKKYLLDFESSLIKK